MTNCAELPITNQFCLDLNISYLFSKEIFFGVPRDLDTDYTATIYDDLTAVKTYSVGSGIVLVPEPNVYNTLGILWQINDNDLTRKLYTYRLESISFAPETQIRYRGNFIVK